jgi:hypothetical protein
MAGSFPQKFHELERWSAWALETESQRNAIRARSTLEELTEFCAAVRPHMNDLIQYLGNFKWGTALGAQDENLYRLGLTYMEATIPIDLEWKQPMAQDSFPLARVLVPERR